jgi:hypothetical protein
VAVDMVLSRVRVVRCYVYQVPERATEPFPPTTNPDSSETSFVLSQRLLLPSPSSSPPPPPTWEASMLVSGHRSYEGSTCGSWCHHCHPVMSHHSLTLITEARLRLWWMVCLSQSPSHTHTPVARLPPACQ